MKLKQLRVINSYPIKLIALATMTVDHIPKILRWVELPMWLTALGRLSFPLFAFLLAEGAAHTRSFVRYLIRVLAVAVVTEPIYDLAFHGKTFCPEYQNVLFTLAAALCAVKLYEVFMEKKKPWLAVLLPLLIGVAAQLCRFSYGLGGVACVLLFYIARSYREQEQIKELLFEAAAIAVTALQIGGISWLQVFALPALLFTMLYDGKPGKSMGTFCYLYYPVHMVVLLLIVLIWAGVVM